MYGTMQNELPDGIMEDGICSVFAVCNPKIIVKLIRNQGQIDNRV